MNFNEYQKKASEYDLFEINSDLNSVGFIEKVLGLAGEAGETADKIKKILRDKDGITTDDDKFEIVKELGDVLWYVAAISRYLDVPLSDVADTNIKKLASRKERNEIHGAGDNR